MRTFRTLFLASAVLAMASCTKTGNDEIITNEGREELKLSGVIQTAEVQSAEVGRATFDKDILFTLFVEDNNDPTYFATDKETTGKAGEAADDKNPVTLDPQLYWDDLGGKSADVDLYGVYPSTATESGKVTGTAITWDITSSEAESDLMRAKVSNYKYADKGTAAHLQFHHVLSKISIVVKHGTGYSAEDLAGAKVTYKIPTTGTYNYKTDVAMAEGTKGDIEILSTAAVADGENKKYTVLSYPLVIEEDDEDKLLATISVTKDGRDDIYNVVINDGVTMAAGNHYLYNVTVNKSGVTVEASIVDWALKTQPNSGTELIVVENIEIDETDDSKLANGARLYLRIKDTNEKIGSAEYSYNFGEKTWGVEGTPLYWDDFTRAFTTEALLNLKGECAVNDNKDAENIMVVTNAGERSDVVERIELGAFKRPFSKITVTVTTSTDANKVNLKGNADDTGLKHIKFLESKNYKITNNVTVLEDPEATNVQVAYTAPPVDGDPTFVAYIMPLGIKAVGYELCEIVIQETATVENTYKLKLPTATTFEAGNHYQYTVKITKSEITTTADVVDWIPVGEVEIPTQLD